MKRGENHTVGLKTEQRFYPLIHHLFFLPQRIYYCRLLASGSLLKKRDFDERGATCSKKRVAFCWMLHLVTARRKKTDE